MVKIIQDEVLSPDTTIAKGGGTAVGKSLNFSDTNSSFSLFLKNEGDSTDLSVTYQVGFIDEADKAAGTITWVTPVSDSAIVNMTNKDCNNSQCHASFSLPCVEYFRFTVTNDDAVNAASVSLYITHQMVV